MYAYMTDTDVLDIARMALEVSVKLAGPPLAAALIVGVVISLFQAVFQIQDQSLPLIPKMAAVALSIVICGPWMLKTIVAFTTELYTNIPGWIG